MMKKSFDSIKRFFRGREILQIEKTLNEIRQMTMIGFAGFQDIEEVVKDWPVGIAKSIQGCDSFLIEKSNEKIVFVTRIPVGYEFPVYWHNDIETCEVLNGCLIDDMAKVTEKKKGEIVTSEPYIRHAPKNGCKENDTLI